LQSQQYPDQVLIYHEKALWAIFNHSDVWWRLSLSHNSD
jgi:hypothetical protein